MASASKSNRFAVPAQVVPPVRVIAQQDLAEILELRHDLETLEVELKAAEQSVRGQLEAGAIVEPGVFRAFLKSSDCRSVPRKQVRKRVLAATKPETFTHLVVEA